MVCDDGVCGVVLQLVIEDTAVPEVAHTRLPFHPLAFGAPWKIICKSPPSTLTLFTCLTFVYVVVSLCLKGL